MSFKQITLNKFALVTLLLVFGGLLFGQTDQGDGFVSQDGVQTDQGEGTSAQTEPQTFAMGEHGSFGVMGSYILVTDFQKGTMNTTYSWYGGLNVYGRVVNNLYMGVEISYVQWKTYTSEQNRTDLAKVFMIPVEANAKYGFEIFPNIVFELGMGLSYAYANYRSQHEALFGFQLFPSINFKFNDSGYVGMRFKYQFLQNIDEYSNFYGVGSVRVGFHLGTIF